MSYEIAKQVDSSMYPEIIEAGSLHEALNKALQECHSSLVTDALVELAIEIPWLSTRVSHAARFSQINIAAKERLYLFDLWNQGVCYGNGSSDSLIQVALAIHFWAEEKYTISQMQEKFGSITVKAQGIAHETGTIVEFQWESLFARWEKREGDFSAQVAKLIKAAGQRPQLRQLYPYTSLYSLNFSQTTGYPFGGNFPHVAPLEKGLYRAYATNYVIVKRCYENQEWNEAVYDVLGEGEVETVLDLIVTNLPPNCGPAIAGTADDLIEDN